MFDIADCFRLRTCSAAARLISSFRPHEGCCCCCWLLMLIGNGGAGGVDWLINIPVVSYDEDEDDDELDEDDGDTE